MQTHTQETNRNPNPSSALGACSAVRNRGYYVCLEECGAIFGNTYLRATGDWNSEYATTGYRDNATYWATAEEAQAVYEAWKSESRTRLAETHRQNKEVSDAGPLTQPMKPKREPGIR